MKSMTRRFFFVILAAFFPMLGHGASFVPSVEITGVAGGTTGSCTASGTAVTLNVYSNEPGTSSDNFVITALVGASTLNLRTWTGENGPFPVGATTYGLGATSGWSNLPVPANTPITATITTYNGPGLSGGAAYISRVTWDCTTGNVLSIVSGPASAQMIPTLSAGTLLLLMLALAALGMVARAKKEH